MNKTHQTETAKPKLSVYAVTKQFIDEQYTHNVIAETPSKAKYKCFLENWSEFWEWHECFAGFTVKKIGDPSPSYFFNSTGFQQMKESRGIDFASLGMEIDVAGKRGVIVGSNSSLNLDVYFDGIIHNCHPCWKTTYYDNAGRTIKSFLEDVNETSIH